MNAVIRATATDANGNTSAFSDAATVGADSNRDGVPDSQQNGNIGANNLSFPDALNPGDPSHGIPPAFVSLSAPEAQGIYDVWSTPDPDPNHQQGPPANTQFPFGFVSFSLFGVDAPPAPVRVTLTLPDTGITPTSYWRYVQPQGDQPGHWYQWDYDSVSDTGAVLPGQIDPHTNQVVGSGQIVLYFVDGRRGDDDGVDNGFIVDAGSPGFADPYTVTTTADSGPGSLRQAILNANANPGSDITFDLPGSGPQTIQLLSPLPAVTANVTIDGSTEPGYSGTPLVVLDGSQAGA
ncbi:MAG: choice-of-anchor U domain-containing protein, partial [Pirellulales bacterium]